MTEKFNVDKIKYNDQVVAIVTSLSNAAGLVQTAGRVTKVE